MNKQEIAAQIKTALNVVYEAGHMEEGDQMVVGCSTSEIAGGRIGKASVPELGEWVAEAVLDYCKEKKLVPVFQCCEHLNRSLVMEKQDARHFGYTRVSAVPQPKAGGSVPAAAWKMMQEPTLVQFVQADGGIDIGDTLIGMHLKPVAVPVRSDDVSKVGYANLVMAYTRLPYVGGSRAVYE